VRRALSWISAVAALGLAGSAALAQAPGGPPIEVGAPGPEGRRIEAPGLFANYFPAKGTPPRPAVLFIGGSEGGVRAGNGGMIGGLTAAGFDVLYVCYFGCPGTPQTLNAVPLETFDRALAWLKSQPQIDARRLAVVGGSKGAEAALLVATRHPELAAVVAAMPSSVVWPGISQSATMAPSWTVDGKPVAFLPYSVASFTKGGVYGLYNDALASEAEHPEAAIPVGAIKAPVMLVCGEADKLWPSCRMADEIARRMAAKGRPAPRLLRYKDAGHAVFGTPVDAATVPRLAALGGSGEGNQAARADSWPKALAFLKRHLQP
jgi:dienelactone hydrolase